MLTRRGLASSCDGGDVIGAPHLACESPLTAGVYSEPAAQQGDVGQARRLNESSVSLICLCGKRAEA